MDKSCRRVRVALAPRQTVWWVACSWVLAHRPAQAFLGCSRGGGVYSPSTARGTATDTRNHVRTRRRTIRTDMMTRVQAPDRTSGMVTDGRTVSSVPAAEVAFYFDEFDFCLDPTDSALTGPSLTKTLNSITNEVVKNILILNSPEDAGPASQKLQALLGKFAQEHAQHPEYHNARAYLDCVCSLGGEGRCPAREDVEALQSQYQVAYQRVATVLQDFGCEVAFGKCGRVRPIDRDLCLAILDHYHAETKTRFLNTISNRVCRTMCVGNDEDLQALAREMVTKREAALSRWVGPDWEGSQEDRYYHSLIRLLQRGLSDSHVDLRGPYANSYQRLVGVLVQEVGTRSAPANEMVLNSFVQWERNLRKNLTEPAWNANPTDLVGSWALGGDMFDDALWDITVFDRDPPVRFKTKAQIEAAEATKLGVQVVTFRADGQVVVSPEVGIGLTWRLEPGPTHLDTIFFQMISAAQADDQEDTVILSYTGYVDRGARIEARFSKRPIKMTGRLTRVVKGTPRPSTRFSMRLADRRAS